MDTNELESFSLNEWKREASHDLKAALHKIRVS